MVMPCVNCCIYIILLVYRDRVQFLRFFGLFNVGLSWLVFEYTPWFRNGFGDISKRRFSFIIYYVMPMFVLFAGFECCSATFRSVRSQSFAV
jgi:hypothetical protein